MILRDVDILCTMNDFKRCRYPIYIYIYNFKRCRYPTYDFKRCRYPIRLRYFIYIKLYHSKIIPFLIIKARCLFDSNYKYQIIIYLFNYKSNHIKNTCINITALQYFVNIIIPQYFTNVIDH